MSLVQKEIIFQRFVNNFKLIKNVQNLNMLIKHYNNKMNNKI